MIRSEEVQSKQNGHKNGHMTAAVLYGSENLKIESIDIPKLAADEVVRRHFTPVTFLPLGRDGAGYVLFARDESAR